jgi:hypothetical protein
MRRGGPKNAVQRGEDRTGQARKSFFFHRNILCVGGAEAVPANRLTE